MVIFSGADEGEDLVGVRDGDGADAGLFLNDMGYLAAGLRSEPWLMMPTVRLAMVSALAEKTRENFSYIRCWSRIMLMKSAARRSWRGSWGGDGAHQQQGLVEGGGKPAG